MQAWRRVIPLALLALAPPVRAQQLPPAAAQPMAVVAAPAPPAGGQPPAAAVAVVASMVLPGSGQWLQGKSRWVPYLALEVWSWLRFRERRHEWRRLTDRYRDLAWSVARRVSVGERRDTVFEYYEALTHYNSSGAWDAAPLEGGLQPEQDTTTFNGQLWSLARSLFYPAGRDYEPGSGPYEAALEYYQTHGIPPSYAWAWGGSSLEQQVFADVIVDSDNAYRDGTRMLGLILANHVASAVDALITARLSTVVGGHGELRTELVPEAGGSRLVTQVRIGL